MRRFVYSTFLLLSSITILWSQDSAWKMDRAHSSARFSVAHMVISEVSGEFSDFTISVTSNKDDFTDAQIDAVIKVASISTGNPNRDNHLKSDDFFNAELFPEIRFKSTSFEKTTENHYAIKGALTIRDSTKTVTMDADYKGTIKTQRGSVVAWKVTLVVNRFDFGLKWNRTVETGGLVAGETVTVTFTLEFRK